MNHSSEHSCSACCQGSTPASLEIPGGAAASTAQATWRFHVAELDCAEEVGLIRSTLEHRSGIVSIRFDLLDRRVDVDVQAQGPDGSQILIWIKQTGLTPTLLTPESIDRQHELNLSSGRRATLELVIGGVANLFAILWAVWIVGSSPHTHSIQAQWLEPYSLLNLPTLIGHAIAIGLCGYRLLPRAWAAVRLRRADMNVLMVVAVAGALLIGEWSEAGLVTWLFALSLRLEQWSLGRARDAIGKLLDLTPATARLRRENGELQIVEVDQVAVGSLIEVLPGDRVPLDGQVTRGESELDLSSLTGESLPVESRTGDEVLAGAINLTGSLTLSVLRPASDSQLARVYRAMKEAQQKRGSTERWVDRFAQWYTPTMALLAIAVAVVLMALFQTPWLAAVHSALVLLVTACPCALVISTPVTVVAALTAAARNGLVLRGGDVLERLSQVDHVAFDKTGTLTLGSPKVTRVHPSSGVERAELLRLAGELEQYSTHPISRAIVEAWQSEARPSLKQPAPSHSASIKIVPGHGVEASDGESSSKHDRSLAGVWAGNDRMLNRHHAAVADDLSSTSFDPPTMSVWVGRDDALLGRVELSDPIRQDAGAAIEQLRSMGIKSIAMLSGDSQSVVDSLAKQLKISEAQGSLLPADKVQRIEDYRQRAQRVLMVGDGVNDAAALSSAHVGLALGDRGSDIAKSAADGVLLRDSLELVPWSIRHAKRSKRILVQNLTAALVVKVIFFGLALSGYSSLWLAILADTGTSLAVIANALRAMRPLR